MGYPLIMNIYYLKYLKLVVICIPRKCKLVYYSQNIVLNTISDKVWYGSYFILIKNCEKKHHGRMILLPLYKVISQRH